MWQRFGYEIRQKVVVRKAGEAYELPKVVDA